MNTNMKLLFIGDVTGLRALEYLEDCLPNFLAQRQPDFVIVNAENLSFTGPRPYDGFGMTTSDLQRLLALGVDAVTGGNHSWDGPDVAAVHQQAQVLRPINPGQELAGKGATILEKNGKRLGVINAISATAFKTATPPYQAIVETLSGWEGQVDATFVDMHGESPYEQLMLAFTLDGQVQAMVGTHTHVPTLDTRILPAGMAYVSDVGMTGPSGGMQGIAPQPFIDLQRSGHTQVAMMPASGDIELGAVWIELGEHPAIVRLTKL